MYTLRHKALLNVVGTALGLLCGLVIGLSISSSTGFARTRCQVKEARLASLSRRLENAESPKLWKQIYDESQATLELIERKVFAGQAQSTATLAQSRPKILCAQELLLESAFFLSDNRIEGVLWAMRALGHAVSISSLSQQVLKHPEMKDRLRLLLKRANRGKKAQRKIKRPFQLAKHQTVFVPAQSKPYELSIKLSQKQHSEWVKRCGLFEACQSASHWKIYPQLGSELSFSLPGADYELIWGGACAQHQNELKLSAYKGISKELSAPELTCYSLVELHDELSQESLPLPQDINSKELPSLTINKGKLKRISSNLGASEGSELSINYQGYTPQTVQVPMQGQKLNIKLKRCAINLEFKLNPSDLSIEGPKRVYWGQPYSLEFSRTGYIPLSKSITVPKPQSCEAASKHLVDVKLSRQVEVKAYDPQNLKVKLSYLKVGGLSLNAQIPHLRRPEGRYQVIAKTQDYPQLTSQLYVPACQGERCDQAQLNLYFQEPPPPPMSTPTRLKWIGSTLLSTGIGLFIYNLSANDTRDTLNYSTPQSPIKERMSGINRWSIALASSGLFTVALGYAWPYLSSNQSQETTLINTEKAKEGQL